MKFFNFLSEESIYAFHTQIFMKCVSYVKKYAIQLELLIVLSMLFLLSAKIPYINLVFTFPVILVIIILLAIILFKIRFDQNMWTLGILFACTFIASLFHSDAISEYIGNIIYLILCIIVVKKIRLLSNV